jgi:putative DNA primase/helicase
MTDERARLHALQGGAGAADDHATFEGKPFLETGPSGRQRFVARRLAGLLRQQTAIATGGQALYVYRDGVYRAGGESDIRARVAEALGDDWKPSRADEVITYLRDTVPQLWESPPLDKINVLNGMLYLDDATFLDPHDPDILSPVQIGAEYDPAATCPQIDAFLDEVLPEGAAQLVHELAGYLATPDNRRQKAVMLLGAGGGGKSTLLSLLTAFIGHQNVSAVSLHTLDENTFATADLYGRLANVFADLDSRALKSSSIFKSITGGDAIRAERKRRDSFTFRPYARLVFSANEAPPTADSSAAFFDRWLVIPFDRTFRGTDAQDVDLLMKLTTPSELSGLLNHALRGLERLHISGFTITGATERAAERFAIDSDSVAGFIDECCIVAAEATTNKKQLHQTYKRWCADGNRGQFSAVRFNARLVGLLKNRGAPLEEFKSSGYPTWRGISVDPAHE